MSGKKLKKGDDADTIRSSWNTIGKTWEQLEADIPEARLLKLKTNADAQRYTKRMRFGLGSK